MDASSRLPQLSIAPGSGNAVLNWAAPLNPTILETTTALEISNSWTTLSGTISNTNGTNALVIPTASTDLFIPTEPQRFFRLRGY